MSKKKLAVVAFGGNALILAGQRGTISEQEANVRRTCTHLLGLIENNFNIVITHGNGPQVGNILLQNIAGEQVYGVPQMPLDICGAYSQGLIGYMIEQQLRNVLEEKGMERDIITLITQVLVDKNDSAFQKPNKPVGPYYSKEEAEKMALESKAVFAEDSKGRGWRKVVASPKPMLIGNRETISKIVREDKIVIAVGGGGIPVFYKEPNVLEGIDAVIDKDLASAMLADQIKADAFYILTDIAKVCINFNKPNQKELDVMTVTEAKEYLAQGQFAEGSMAPKVRAAIQFVENGGKETIITTAAFLGDKNSGTRIIFN